MLVAAPFTIVAVAGAVAYQAVASARDATERVERSTELILTANLVAQEALDAETGVRAYLLVGDPELLAPYEAASASLPARVDRLEGLVAGEPAQVERVAEVRAELQRFEDELAQPAIEARRDGTVSGSQLAELAVEADALVDALRDRLDEVVAAERAAGGAEADAEQQRSLEAARLAVLSAVAASLFALVAALASARHMATRIDAVTGGARALADGDLHQRLEPSGEDEITELGRAFNAMADRLDRRTHDLESTNRELESFSYTVSHDLRAPLRAVRAFSEILDEEHGDQLDEEGHRILGRVRAAAGRMSELIDDLLALARVSRDQLAHVDVDLTALCEEVLDELRSHEPAREVTTVVAPGLHVTGDPPLLRVAFENLLGNAWKFTSRQPDAHIRVRPGLAPVPPHMTVVVVDDDGAGFDMTYADSLFEPFRRLHHESEFEGTGVGLATVHRIVERHGGTVEAQSAPGQGARFTVVLPA